MELHLETKSSDAGFSPLFSCVPSPSKWMQWVTVPMEVPTRGLQWPFQCISTLLGEYSEFQYIPFNFADSIIQSCLSPQSGDYLAHCIFLLLELS